MREMIDRLIMDAEGNVVKVIKPANDNKPEPMLSDLMLRVFDELWPEAKPK